MYDTLAPGTCCLFSHAWKNVWLRMVTEIGSMGAGVMTTVASYLGPVTVGAHHVVQSTYMFFCTCGDAVSQAAQSFLPGKVRRFLPCTFGAVFLRSASGSAHSVGSV